MISSELFSKRMYVKKGIIVQKQTTLEVEKPLKFSALISFFPSLQSTNSIIPVNWGLSGCTALVWDRSKSRIAIYDHQIEC